MKSYNTVSKLRTDHCDIAGEACARVNVSDFCGRRTGKRTCNAWGARVSSKCSARLAHTNCSKWVCEHAETCTIAVSMGKEPPRIIN